MILFKLKYLYTTSITLIFLFAQCAVPKTTECICIGSAINGSYITKAYGYSYFQRRAIENAKRNAVMEALFKGVKAGSPGCVTRPIIDNPSKINSPYFQEFFKRRGEYLQYVNLSDDEAPDRTKVGLRTKAGMVVIVDHRRLQKHMVEIGESKGINHGF